MTQLEKLLFLNRILIDEMPEYKKQATEFLEKENEQQILFRSLVNLRSPKLISKEFLKVQDEFLREETEKKIVVSLADLQEKKPNIYLWQGDITRLCVDAIVNAANDALLGCFIPCHKCIDNAIHFFSGLQLRQECKKIMDEQGHKEATGKAKITNAYNLPCKHIIHTVGPIIYNKLTKKDCELLASCYEECLKLVIKNNLKSIAFCCISTGEFCFPNDRASKIAVETVERILAETQSEIKVVFNVFKEEDRELYGKLLG
ncbi:MAG: protein-ADP-ribose hydrolase [Clostridia bacterium]